MAAGQGVALGCPGCGGELRADLGWRELLRPEMVCLACGARWIDSEATTRWRLQTEQDDNGRVVRRHLNQQLILGIVGLILIPVLFSIWWDLELREVLVESPSVENLFNGANLRGELWTALLFVPVLALSWFLMLAWMVRRRTSSIAWAVLTCVWCLLTFVLALGLGTSGVLVS